MNNLKLTDIVRRFTKFFGPKTAYKEVLSLLSEEYQADRCQIMVFDDLSGQIETRAISPTLKKDDFSRTVLARAISERRPLCFPNVKAEPDYRNNPSVINLEFLTAMVVPLSHSGEMIGALYLDRRRPPEYIESNMQEVIEVGSILTTFLIKQEQLFDLMLHENSKIKTKLQELGMVIGENPDMERSYQRIGRYAALNETVYIYGETGTGKELIVRALHELSNRPAGKFIAKNCAAINDELAESELFGHIKGAFSGAIQDKRGLFELANGGTLVLDEVGELSLDIQAKLLRVIQEREIQRVGDVAKVISVDISLIIATNHNLEEDVAAGDFREDLFHRLNRLRITLPPLRERKEDIVPLANHFLSVYSNKFKCFQLRFTNEAHKAMLNYHWPGNIRDLENRIMKAVVDHEAGRYITDDDLFPEQRVPLKTTVPSGLPLDDMISALERKVIKQALVRNIGNKTKAAEELGITTARLRRILEKSPR